MWDEEINAEKIITVKYAAYACSCEKKAWIFVIPVQRSHQYWDSKPTGGWSIVIYPGKMEMNILISCIWTVG